MIFVTDGMMRITTILFLLLVSSTISAQMTEELNYDGRYYGRFYKKEKLHVFLDMKLYDSIYFIDYKVIRKNVTEIKTRYIGTYSVNSTGTLNLKGKHPFKKEHFLLQTSIKPCSAIMKEAGYNELWEAMFTAEIQDSLSPMKRFKMNIICGKTSSKIYRDGLYRDFWSQGCCPPSFFRPGQRALFKDYTTSENIFQKSITESGFSCSQKDSLIPAGQKFDQPEMHSFWVDSMRFDTIYVNKLLIEKRNSYYVQRDTFCLKETMRLQLNHDEYNYIGLIEQAEIFKEPTCESAPLFTQSEIDKCKKLIITGYLKDSAGVEWIKISLDAIVFNEELEIEEPKYFEGWILQKTLQVN